MSKYNYEFERVNAYCYPNSNVLRNKLSIQDLDILHEAERRLTGLNLLEIKEKPIKGKFNLKHLQAIHKYVFGDIYDWAGELRTVNIAKGNQFCNYVHLETYANGIFSKLKSERFLIHVSTDDFAERLTYYLAKLMSYILSARATAELSVFSLSIWRRYQVGMWIFPTYPKQK